MSERGLRISRFRLASALGLARLVLFWERLWPRLWPAAAVLGMFAALALLDVFRHLPMWLHIALLVVFALGFVALLVRAGRDLAPVSEAEARHRVELASGLTHRPLTALDDRLANVMPSRDERALWAAYRGRVAAQVRRLRVGWPRPGMAARDPYALRSLLVMVLAVAVVAGMGDAGPRFFRALVPQERGPAGGPELVADLWITPPAYTGLAPILLEDVDFSLAEGAERSPLLLPVGSTVLAQLTGPSVEPALHVGARNLPFEELGGKGAAKGARLEAEIADEDVGAKQLVLDAGEERRAAWPVAVAADTPPEIEFTRAPGRTGPGHLEIAYLAQDDYGLVSLAGVIRRPEGAPVFGEQQEIRFSLPVGRAATQTEGSATKDFTAHPWAGLPVEIYVEATDAAGHVGRTDVIETVLPARVFQHPVARALVDLRRQLVEDPSEQNRNDVAALLDDLSAYPKRFYDDTVAYLAMRIVRGRLLYDGGKRAVAQSVELLWNTALRIEDGDYAIAEQELMKRQEELMQALEDGASSEELDRLMQELQQAMQEFFAALSEKLSREGIEELPFMPQTQMMQSGDLQRMLEQAREMAQAGQIEAAKRQLAQIQQMLEQLRNGSFRTPPKGELAKMRKTMDELRDLARRQQEMLDRTFEQARRNPDGRQQDQQGQQQGAMPGQQGEGEMQQGQKGQQGQGRMGQGQMGQGQMGQGQMGQGQRGQRGQQGQPGEGGRFVPPSAAEQEALRRRLGELMMQMDEMLGSIPPSLGEAERSMNNATGSLRKGRPGEAVPYQSEALDKLRQATEQAAEQMAQRMGGMMGMMPQQGRQGGQGQGRDPFGRDGRGTGGMNADTTGVKVPDKMDMQRARDILDELRRRAGERGRPTYELDYIERLLERF